MPDRPYDPFSDPDLDDPSDQFRPRPPLRVVRPTDHTRTSVPERPMPATSAARVPDDKRDENGRVPLSDHARAELEAMRAKLPPTHRRLEPPESTPMPPPPPPESEESSE
jgi:hypothetical protein